MAADGEVRFFSPKCDKHMLSAQSKDGMQYFFKNDSQDHQWPRVPSMAFMDTPMSAQWNYFEVEIINSRGYGGIAIALGPAHHKRYEIPDETYSAIISGSIISSNSDELIAGTNVVATPFGVTVDRVFRIGCGVDFDGKDPDTVTVWFTQNGRLVDSPEKFSSSPTHLYPIVMLRDQHDLVCYSGHVHSKPLGSRHGSEDLSCAFQPVESRQVIYPSRGDQSSGMLSLNPDDVVKVVLAEGEWWLGMPTSQFRKTTCGFFYKDFTTAVVNTEVATGFRNNGYIGRRATQRGEPRFSITYRGKDFVSDVPPTEEMECIICQEVASQPRQTLCCGKTACWGCATKWTGINNSCPACRQAPLQLSVSGRLERTIADATVYCGNFSHGCRWVGRLADGLYHLEQSCQEEQLPCEYQGCNKVGPRHRLRAHMSKDCQYRPVVCPRCGKGEGGPENLKPPPNGGFWTGVVKAVGSYLRPPFTYHQLIGEHSHQCQQWPMRCANNCPKSGLTRSSMRAHLDKDCPEQLISCQFSEAGCGVRVKRKEMEEHIQQAMGQHMQDMMKDYIAVKRNYISVKKELDTCKEEYSAVRTELADLRKEVRQMKGNQKSYFFN